MDDWDARGGMAALDKAQLAKSLLRNCADEGGTGC